MQPVKYNPPRIGPRNPCQPLIWSRYDYQGHGELHSPRVQPGGPSPQPVHDTPDRVRVSKADARKRYQRGVQTYHADGMSPRDKAIQAYRDRNK